MRKPVIDNQSQKLLDRLKPRLKDAAALRVVSAYFSIYGFDSLADELESVPETRFLYGDSASIEEIDPGEKPERAFNLLKDRLHPIEVLRQKPIAERCEAWVKRPETHIRSIVRSNFLHGKMWHIDKSDKPFAVVGSSNFTRNGLGGGNRPNLEINLAADSPQTCAELQRWFDNLWGDSERVKDVKAEVLDALRRIGKEYSPESVYFKTLFELFQDDWRAYKEREEYLKELKLTETQVWNKLYRFQQDGVQTILNSLEKHNGCLLADSVGLGKTYTALAAIKYYELRNENVLVLCPRKLREQWELYLGLAGHEGNPFPDDRFAYSLLSHTDLSRDKGKVGYIDLANFNWSAFGLVVIDESHNFRNKDGQRYQKLMNEIIREGVNTKVLMLSATPVNTSLIDLRNQIYLMTEDSDGAFKNSLNIPSLQRTLRKAQEHFNAWKPADGKSTLFERLGADFQSILAAVTISRSRKQIETFYSAEMERIGAFPERKKPRNLHPPTDLEGMLSYERLAEQIEQFQLSIYRPTDYVVSEARLAQLDAEKKARNFNQQDREKFLIGMIRVNFLKRLESAPHSLKLTLQRTVDKIDILIERIDRYIGRPSNDQTLNEETSPYDEPDDDDFIVNKGKNPFKMSELNVEAWRKDLLKDRDILNEALRQVKTVTPERDGKLDEIKRHIRRRAENPSNDKNGKPNRKLILFTTFKDTALYLYEHLAPLADELNLNMAMVAGDETHTKHGANDFHTILDNFAPIARKGKDAVGDPDIDLLIATDCVSEGMNLQDCDRIVNYDIHWNPVKLIQRLGRIDRIGSDSVSIQMTNFWPTEDMEAYLKLESRVRSRMALADIAATGDDNPFEEETLTKSVQRELTFRDKQLLKMRTEIADLEELEDGPTMSDFSFAHFIGQLLEYLRQKEEELKRMSYGTYAVVKQDGEAKPGVLFFLRQTNDNPDEKDKTASPVAPHYAVYILDDGTIRYGCASARRVLEVFEAAAYGVTEPIQRMCDLFNRETDNGQRMARYDKLVQDAAAHIKAEYEAATYQNMADGDSNFMLPVFENAPQKLGDFKLITWLVILDPEHERYKTGHDA